MRQLTQTLDAETIHGLSILAAAFAEDTPGPRDAGAAIRTVAQYAHRH